MALSGSYSANYRGLYTIRTEWSAVQDKATNTSIITAHHYFIVSASLSIGARTHSCNISGDIKSFSSPAINSTGTYDLGTTTHSFVHDKDGYKTVNATTSFYLNATISGIYVSYITAEDRNIVLDRILRTPDLGIGIYYSTPRAVRLNFNNTWGQIKGVKFTLNGEDYEYIADSPYSFIAWTIPNLTPNTQYTLENLSAMLYDNIWSDEIEYSFRTPVVPTIVAPTKLVEGDNLFSLANDVGSYVYLNLKAYLRTATEGEYYELDLGDVYTDDSSNIILTIDDDMFTDFASHSIYDNTVTVKCNGTVYYAKSAGSDELDEVETTLSLKDFLSYSTIKPTLGTPMSHTVDAQTQVFTTTGVILGHTDMTLTIPASTAKLTTSGADVDKYRLQIGTQDIYIDASSTQSVTYTIEELNVASFKVSVIDTRGIESDATIYNYTSYSYTKPTISAQSTINRDGSDLTQATISIVGTYKYFSEFTTNKNQITSVNITCEDRDIEATGISYSEGGYTCNYTTAFPSSQDFDPTESYQITITVTDLVGESTSQTFTLEPGSGTIVVDKRNKRVGINTLPDEYPFEVNGDINIVGDDPKFRINGEAFEGGGGGDSLPIGFISGWGTDTPPDGWLICDGSAISRTAYNELFSVIGTYWGAGDGTTTFNVPNMKGRVLVGQDLGDSDFSLVGSYLGEKTHTLTTNEIPSHNHEYQNAAAYKETSSAWGLKFNGSYADTGGKTQNTGNAGGGQAHNNLQPSGVGNYIIKYAQVSTEALPKEAGIPVGSILEFNGTEDQIPVGYAKYEETKNSICLGLGSESRSWSGTGWSILTLPQIIEQKGNKITTSNDGGAIIGNGIHRIRVICNLAIQSLGASNWFITDITRKRGTSSTQISKNIVGGSSASWVSTHMNMAFDVEEGDIIYFRVNKDMSGSITFHNLIGNFGSGPACYMYIEEVQ